MNKIIILLLFAFAFGLAQRVERINRAERVSRLSDTALEITTGALFEILAENYGGTIATNTGTATNRYLKEEGTITSESSPPAIIYDGTNTNRLRAAHTEVDEQLFLESGTLETIIYVTDHTVSHIIFALTDSGSTANYFAFYTEFSDSLLSMSNRTSATDYLFKSTQNINSGKWYHIVFQGGSGNVFRLYINGVQESMTYTTTTDTSKFITGASLVTARARVKCALGGLYRTTALTSKGKIGEVRLYSAYLTETQILNNYNARKTTYGYD